MTAIAVGKYFKVPARKIRHAIAAFVPSMNRSQIGEYRGATVIMDAYNANPSSMKQALLNLAQMPQRRKVAILGDMRELGETSIAEHANMLNLAKSLPFDAFITVGMSFGSVNTEGVHFQTNDEAKAWFQSQIFDKDTCILIKGSRGMKLEILTQ